MPDSSHSCLHEWLATQRVYLAQDRGTVFAIFALTDDIGKGLSPMLAAALIGAAGGRTQAFNWTMVGWLLCGLILFGMMLTVDGDVRRMHKRLAREGELYYSPSREGAAQGGGVQVHELELALSSKRKMSSLVPVHV